MVGAAGFEPATPCAQAIGMASKGSMLFSPTPPFILCGLAIRRLPAGVMTYTRRNGKFFLEIVSHPDHGVPFSQDRPSPSLPASKRPADVLWYVRVLPLPFAASSAHVVFTPPYIVVTPGGARSMTGIEADQSGHFEQTGLPQDFEHQVAFRCCPTLQSPLCGDPNYLPRPFQAGSTAAASRVAAGS